jgi:hypothetical protein
MAVWARARRWERDAFFFRAFFHFRTVSRLQLLTFLWRFCGTHLFLHCLPLLLGHEFSHGCVTVTATRFGLFAAFASHTLAHPLMLAVTFATVALALRL